MRPQRPTLLLMVVLVLALAGCGQGKSQGPPTFDLGRERPALTVSAAQPADGLISVATGDVNGDGHLDVIAGAPQADGPGDSRPHCGEAYVIFGPATQDGTVDLARQEQDVTILGADSEDYLGFSIAVGDVNGDGIDDILLGAPLADGPDNARYQGGEAYLVLGGPSLGGTRDMARGEYDLAITSADEDDQLGYSVAMGDLNSDGIDDLILGAFRADGPGNGRNDAGEVDVIFSSRALGGVLDLASTPPGVTVAAADPDDHLGQAVASGDVNGDGIEDLLIGAPAADGPDNGRDSAGEAYVIFGSPTLQGSMDVGRGEQNMTILGADPGDHLGAALASGDMDGDGIEDILLGAEGADGRENDREDAGEVHVILGSASLEPTADTAVGDHGATILGEQEGDAFGSQVAAADWDGDGRADVLATAPDDGREGAGGEGGRAYVISIGPRLREKR